MSLTARVYIGVVIAVGAAALGRGFFLWDPHDVPRFFCYLVLAVPASCLKVALPGVTGTMSVLFLFLLASLVELGLPEALLIGSTCALVQSFWRAKVRPRAVQVLFSVAEIAVAISAAHFVYRSPLLLISYVQAPFRLAAAASVFFATNTFLVAAVIALTECQSLRQVWSRCYFWSFPYYLVGAAIVGMFSFANRTLDWQAWLLILPVVYVIYRSYHLYLGQLETERRHTEEQRQHAKEVASLHAKAMEALASAVSANTKLDAVIQASPLAILAVDPGGNVASWNTMAERMFGWSSEEVLGRPLPFGDETSEDTLSTIVDRTFRGELLSGIEITQRRKDGSSFEASVWTAPLRDAPELICSILVTVADVSDRKRLEEQLRLSQKMEAVGRLAGGIAHDFNNLLTIINGYSAMLLDSLRDDLYVSSQAEEIMNAGKRAADLVSQLLTFSRRSVIKPNPVDINQLVRDIGRMLRPLIGEHIGFRTVADPEAGWIEADPTQMEAVLMNLVTNARDAMPNGGALSVETARVDVIADRQAKEGNLAPGSYVCLAVRDTGHGMDAETQRHVFEPFFTTKQQGKGTGLGLSSVYGMVQQNAGRIFVASEVGKGTTFSIYLPRLKQASSFESRRTTPYNVSQGTETILLVEDEIPLRRMLREALSKAGYGVWEAGNGAEGLEQWEARAGQINLLVTDVVMPVMNGLRLAEELRERCSSLSVIFMSGHAEDVISSQGQLDPALELLPKPFVPDVLVRKVREVLDQAHNRVRSGTPI